MPVCKIEHSLAHNTEQILKCSWQLQMHDCFSAIIIFLLACSWS